MAAGRWPGAQFSGTSSLPSGTRAALTPILLELAAGESAAFEGFGHRVGAARHDMTLQTWLCAHLLDEAKHAESLRALLPYISDDGKPAVLRREATVYHGEARKCSDIGEWLMFTHVIEVYTRQCYSALSELVAADHDVAQLFRHIIQDESRHIHALRMFLLGDAHSPRSERYKRAEYSRIAALADAIFFGDNGGNAPLFAALGIRVDDLVSRARDELQTHFRGTASDRPENC